jgi:hypothetical protein
MSNDRTAMTQLSKFRCGRERATASGRGSPPATGGGGERKEDSREYGYARRREGSTPRIMPGKVCASEKARGDEVTRLRGRERERERERERDGRDAAHRKRSEGY